MAAARQEAARCAATSPECARSERKSSSEAAVEAARSMPHGQGAIEGAAQIGPEAAQKSYAAETFAASSAATEAAASRPRRKRPSRRAWRRLSRGSRPRRARATRPSRARRRRSPRSCSGGGQSG